MTDETVSQAPATPEVVAPAPAPADLAQSAGQDMHVVIEAWFVKHFHDNSLSMNTDFFNTAYAAKEALYAAFGSGEVQKVTDVIEHWLATHYAALATRVPAGGEDIISTAKEELQILFPGEAK